MVSVQKQYGYYLIWTLTNLVFPVVVFPYVARFLEPQGLGEAQFALQFSRYFMMLASLGIPIYGVRELAKIQHDETKRNLLCSELLSLQIIAATFTSIVYILIIQLNGIQVSSSTLLWIAGLQVFFSWTSIEWLLIGLEAFKTIAFRTLLLRFVTSLTMLLLIQSPADSVYYIAIVVASFVGGNLLLWLHVLNLAIRFRFNNIQLAKHLKPLALLSLTQLCIIMYTVFDTVWVGLLSSAVAVGLYTTALKLSKIGIALVTSLGNMLIPKTARSLDSNRVGNVYLEHSFLFVVDLSVPMSVGLFILAPELVLLFSGEAYLPAINAMRILAVLPICIGLSNLFGMQILAVSGKELNLLKSVSFGLLVHLILSMVLIPFYAETGAAWAMLGAEMAVLVATLMSVKQEFTFQFPWQQVAFNVLISSIFIPIIWGIRNAQFQNWSLVLLSLACCVTVYGLMQYWFLKQSIVQLMVQQFLTKKAK